MQRSTWTAWSLSAAFSLGIFLASVPASASPSASAALSPPETSATTSLEGVDASAAYIQSLEQKFNKVFYGEFTQLASYEVVGAPDAKRTVEVRFAVRWDGTLALLQVAKTSGVAGFDDGALDVVKRLAPYRPPVDVLADDGLAHFLWKFGRRSDDAGGRIEHVEFPLSEAIPRLVAAGRAAEAERRVKEALENPTVEAGILAVFARSVLAQPTSTPEESLAVAQEHAVLRDGRAGVELRRWLFSPETAPGAAGSMVAAGLDISSDVKRALEEGGSIRQAGVAIVLTVPGALTSCESCLQAVIDVTRSNRRAADMRVNATKALGYFRTGALQATAQEALKRLCDDSDPNVRAAALLSSSGPEEGRKTVFKMAALLKDASPAVRGAAAAAVLRAGGDREIEQLYGVYRERNDVAFAFVAEELGQQKGPATLDMLTKLLRKAQGKRRVMLIEALAARTDAPARALVEPILDEARRNSDEDVAIRRLALRGASPTDILTMAGDTRLGLDGYRALLTNGMAREAASWLLDRYDALDSVSRLRALGLWLAPRGQQNATVAASAH